MPNHRLETDLRPAALERDAAAQPERYANFHNANSDGKTADHYRHASNKPQ